eukprot:CAMPEP_0183391282 /NCGR_PEP_ID=MMETSP0370-20130417/6331_1 /TAXON_ID=268820 /ORGANISM="Peridinium aciculiferum, Strain PAER-2" /LENGTH=214 /DNA_ID=CAMNT_0025570975 /DNA_START=98 /DNA_END=742 /DNA_ORIENTATION=-
MSSPISFAVHVHPRHTQPALLVALSCSCHVVYLNGTSTATVCTRCRRAGHLAQDCQCLPFLRLQSVAEERGQRQARRAETEKQFEARKAENENKCAEFESRKAAWALRQAARPSRKDADKSASESACTESTAPSTGDVDEVDAAEVESRASMDKEVRKLAKVLREICKLEECDHLETLQSAKVARKPEVQSELESVLGLARARARNEMLREQAV